MKINNLSPKDLSKLQKLANACAVKFEAPIYLVGSTIDSKEEPLDLDIIIALNEDQFSRLIGGPFKLLEKSFEANKITTEYDLYLRLKMKYKKFFESELSQFVDLKFLLKEEVEKVDKERIRLDMFSDYF